jgi:hypothetical protein
LRWFTFFGAHRQIQKEIDDDNQGIARELTRLSKVNHARVTVGGKASPLLRILGGRGCKQLWSRRMARPRVLRRHAGGITAYLLNGGLLEYAMQIAERWNARTTKLYDRRNDQVMRDHGADC